MPKLSRTDRIKSSRKNKHTILIVEDGNVNFILLKTIILKVVDFECDIVRAENGLIAVEFCKNNFDIDLVLMDIQMPVMNGFDATLQIKKIQPKLHIIAQTAYTSKENRDMAIHVGCSDFISKPIHKERVAAVINQYIKRHIA